MELKKIVSATVFWGAAWGITEATLGCFLHAINFSIGWAIWFPIAFYFMNKAYKQTGKYESILFVSALAAAIKLVDLALPIRIDRVINPAASILFEGLVVFATYKLLEKRSHFFKNKIFEIATMSFSWRILYAVYVLFLPAWMQAISPVRDLANFAKFFFIEGSAGAIIIFAVMKLSEKIIKIPQPKFLANIDYLPLSALGLFIAAIFTQWVF